MPAPLRISDQDLEKVARLRAGDEEAFRALVRQHHTALVRFARTFVKSTASAEDVVQESWLGVVKGIARFEGRSTLKAWIYSIVANRARTRATRDGRIVTFSALEDDGEQSAVDPSRFKRNGMWAQPPLAWETLTPERLAASSEVRAAFEQALDDLPDRQRAVVVLRDVEGLSSEEACNVLQISETNQRVLLHRARSRLRESLAGLVERP